MKVLVTAGGGGIGLEIVRAFLAANAQVYACDTDEAALAAARLEMPQLLTGVCDVSDRMAVEAMAADATSLLGGLDVLVNNAGIGGPTKPLHEVDPSEWESVLAVNLTGVFYVTRCIIPHMIRSGGGSIINMSSVAGRLGYPDRAPYAVTKWGLVGLTKTLSMELGKHDIRVNAIAPGAVDGERIERVFVGRAAATGKPLDEVKRIALANQSIKRLVDPSEIGALAVFLASDAARSISGQVISIDGDYQRN